MLESLLSQVLTNYLGKYVKGLDGNNLNLAIWKGDVALYNLELKIEAFQELDFLKAVTLKSGIVGKLNLKIPWSNLRSEPINCILEDVYAVLQPNTNFTWDEAAENKKEQEDKLLRVQQLEAKSKGKELAIDASKTTPKASSEGESFFSSLATKIIDNIQLSIKNVHIRYEDSFTNVNNPFNIGIFLEDFSILSTDPNFTPAFLTESHSIIYKLLTLKKLAVYWNSNESPLSFTSNRELAQLLQKQIAGEQQYLIHPISLSVKAIVNKNHEDSSIPQITGDIIVNDITLSLSEIQYKDILNAVDFYAKTEKRWKNRKIRPKVSVKEDPKSWWKYALNATTCEYKTHNYKWSKAYIEQRRKDRLSYVLLYKDLLKKNQTPRDKTTLEQLEEKLSAEDIVFFRSLAKQELKRDGYPVELLEAALNKDKSTTSNWYSWLSWGGSSTPSPQTGGKDTNNEGSPLPQLTKEQREEIFSAIEYHGTPSTPATASIQTKWPKDAIKFQFAFLMQSGSMLLLGNTRETLGAVRFEGFEIGCKVYEETISVGASLRDTQIHDHCTTDSLFPLIMSPINKDERVFDLLFKYKPFDEPGTDIYVYMNSQPLRIVYSKQWVDRIITFFSVPSQDVVTPSGLQVRNFTKSFEEKFQEKYQQQLETAIESRQNLSINVTIQAPQIIIPQDVTSKESVLIIADFGKLSIIKTIDLDQNHIENLIYSTFRINMNSLHLFTTTSDQYLLVMNSTDSIQCDYIIHDFNVDFSVQVCTIDDLELPKIRVFANLPALQLSVSNKLIKQIYLVLNSISSNPSQNANAVASKEHNKGRDNANEIITAPTEKGATQPTNSTKAEIALSINLLSLVLKQEDGSDLVKVSFEKLGAHAVQRAFDIKFDIVLQYFYIEDCLQKNNNEEFKYLVASNRDESQPLIKISYYYIQKESPSYELIDSLVYVNMNALYIMFNRATVVQLIQFFNVVSTIFSPPKTITTSTSSPTITSIKASLSNPSIRRSASTLGSLKASHNKKNVTTLKLTVNLQSIRLTLNKEGQKLGICAVEDAVVVCSLKEKSMHVSGILGKLKFQDVSIANKVNDIIIIQEGEDLIQFEYKTFDPEDKDYPNYGKSIKVQINTVRFLYLESFISSIQKYFNEISEMQQLVSSTTTYATGVVNEIISEQNNADISMKTKSISNIKFEVLASNPQVMIPCTASNTYILADFGQIYVLNKFKLDNNDPFEEISVNVRQLNLQYLEVKSQTESNSLILENTDVTVTFFRPMYGSTSPIRLYIDIPKLGILLDQDKMFVIIDTYKQFFPPQPQPQSPASSSSSSSVAKPETVTNSSVSSSSSDLLQMQLCLNVGLFNISMFEMKTADTKENVFPLDLIQLTSDTDINSNDISEDAFIKMHIKGRDLDKKHKIGSKSDAYLLISRYSGNLKVQIYKSETINNSLNPKWKNFIIPAKDIRNEETVIFEVFHSDPMKTSDSLIGSFETTLSSLVNMKHIELINRDIKAKKKEYRNSGFIDIITLEIIDTQKQSSSTSSSSSNTYKTILKQQYSASTSNSSTPSFTPTRSLDVSAINVQQNQSDLEPRLLATLNFSQVGLKFAKTAKASYLTSSITLMELLDGRDDTEIKRIFLLDNFSLKLDIKDKLLMQLEISRFCCNLLFDPILPVYDFIMNAVNRFSAVDNKTLSTSSSTSSTNSTTTSSSNPTPPPPQFELFLSLDRFESYIFSTPAENDLSNRKLIMRNQILVKYFMKDKEQRVEVLLDKFQISRQIYSLEENPVIPPTTISINSTNIKNKSSLSVDILPNLTLALSYQDISLIQQLIASFYSAPRKLINTFPPPPTPPTTTASSSPNNANNTNEFQIDVEFQDIIIDLVNESPDIPPLVRFELQGPKFKGDFSQNLMQKFLIKSYYYNLQRAVWEPLIEPWYFSFVYQNGVDNTTMTIKSTQLLDITISSTFLKETLNLWYKDLISITSSKKFCPLSIRNQTLNSIYFKFNESTEEEEELAPTTQQSITSLHTNRLNTKKIVYDQVCLNIRAGDFTMSNLNILEEGIIPLKHSKQSINDNLIYQVEFTKGQRIITFGSNIILYNKSSLPLQVKVEDTVQSTSYLMTVPVLEHDSVPIEFISNGSIYFRPLKEDNKPLGNTWSSPKLDCNTLSKMSTCISVMNLDQGEFNYNVKIDEQKISGVIVYSIYVYAPLVIENVYSDAIKFKLIGNNETTGVIKKGESLTTYAVNISQPVKLQIQVPDFFEWSDIISLHDVNNPPFTFQDEQKNTFNLFYDKSHLENTLHLTLYSKYWIVNRTEFNLIYYQNKELAAGQSTKLQQVRSIENYSNRDWFHLEAATKPTIFNFSANKCSIQVESGGVSKPVSFSAIQEGEIMIKDAPTKKQFYLGISVAMAPTKYRRTKLVTISPRYLLVNKSKEIIYYQQAGNDQRFTLNIDQIAPYHFIDRKGTKQLSISMDLGNKWRWSGGFPLGNIGSFYVNLIHISTNEIYFMRVDISVDRGTIIIIFRPKSKAIAPYRIENMCKEPISFWQDNVDEIIHNLEPSKSVYYAYDEITKPHYIYIKNDEYQFKHRYSLDKIKKHNSSKLSVEVFPDGPTKVFRIQPATESILDSTDRSSSASTSSTSSSSRSSKREETEKSFQTISIIELDSIGLSIVDSNPREIAFIYFEGLYATYTQSKYQTSLQVSLKTFQIDNQLYFTPYPTVLRPINNEVDVFRASIVKSNEYPTIEFYNYFSVLVQELDISIDSSWLNEMLKFADFNGASQFDKQSDDTINSEFVTDWNDTSRIIYFEIIHINPLKLNVSYYSPERNLQNLSEEQGQIELFVGGIIDKIPNMENASIKLNSLLLEYPSGTQQEIVSRISSHYVSQAIRESYKILGSFEFLGNPINTVSNLGTGIKDFFYEPLHGILLGPEEFKKGLSKGAKSLLKGTVYGLFNASSKITQGISKGFATISLDQEYQIERSKKSAHKPDNIKDGFKEAGKDLGKGVFEGITGLITQPVKGVKQEGVIGLFKGVGRGIVGVGVKPTAGIFDAFSNITQGISNRMIKKNVHRIRFPRHVGKEKILESYSPEKAFRQLLITVLKDGKYNKEIATYHIILDKKLYLVTNIHLFCLNNENFNINWKVRYPRIASIQKKQTDVIVKEGKVTKEAKIIDSNEESPVSSSQLARLRGADKAHTIRTNDEQLATQVFTILNDIWSTQSTSIETTVPSSTEKKFISIFKREETPKKQQSQQQLHDGTPPDEEKKKGGFLSRLRRKQHD